MDRDETTAENPQTPRRRRLLRILGRSALAAGGGVLALLYLAPWFFPLPEDLRDGARRGGLLFTDREGRPLRRLLDGELRAEEPAAFAEFPERLVQATLAAEDLRFFSHGGIDLRSVARALRDAAAGGRFVSGASTITQQTVKLHSPPRPRHFGTKIGETFSARRLEMSADKETILAAYLNRLPYGNQFSGARAAARGYFGKPLGDLSLAEAALLAGLPNQPSRLNPWRNPEGARRRQLWILGRMEKAGVIDAEDLAAAKREPLQLRPKNEAAFHAPHFVELVLARESAAVAAARDAGRGRLRTTLDLPLQQAVEDAVASELARLARKTGEDGAMQAAVVVLSNADGAVLALSGSRSFFASAAGQINGAWRPRSAGSTLKPFLYALALAGTSTAATMLPDVPVEYATPSGIYEPVNYDRRFRGPVSVRHALGNSLNVPAVRLLEELGGPHRLHDCLVDGLRFTSLDTDPAHYGLGLSLGNAEVRLLELANGYAALARLGIWRPVRMLGRGEETGDSGEGGPDRVGSGIQQGSVATDRVGSETQEGSVRVFDRDAAWLVADILSDEGARAASFGRNSALQLPFRTAAKTGTSTDFRDSWTVGYTPDFTVGVWVGRFDNRPLASISGAMGAAPIYHRVMLHLHRYREPAWYATPPSAERLSVDRISGLLPPDSIDLAPARWRDEWFLAGRRPGSAGPEDYDESGRTRLPHLYAAWWKDPANSLHDLAFVGPPSADEDGDGDGTPHFAIASPRDGTVAFIDPDLPRSGSRFPLRIEGGDGGERIEWSSETLAVEIEGDASWLVLEEGVHEVTARDRRSGRTARSRLEVRAL